MAESLKVRDVIRNPRSTLAILLMAGAAIAGCGNTKSAEDNPLGVCGSNDYSVGGTTFPESSKVIETAKQDVLTLHARALRVGGSIDLPRYEGRTSTTEITTSPDQLTLNFARTADKASSTDIAIDHINFPIKNKDPQISQGAVMCYTDHGQLVTNGTFETLQQYVRQTESLDK